MSRINILQTLPDALKAMLQCEQYIRGTSLEPKLRELIKVRASQLNGCAYCLDMHTHEAMQIGETPRRLFAVAAWHEASVFTEEERIILQVTDEITHIGEAGLSDETYAKALELLGEEKLALVIVQVTIINMWNRFGVASELVYDPEKGH